MMPIYSIIDMSLFLKKSPYWIRLAWIVSLNKANDIIAKKISVEGNMKVNQL